MNPEPIGNHGSMQDVFDPVLTHLILLIKRLQPVEARIKRAREREVLFITVEV